MSVLAFIVEGLILAAVKLGSNAIESLDKGEPDKTIVQLLVGSGDAAGGQVSLQSGTKSDASATMKRWCVQIPGMAININFLQFLKKKKKKKKNREVKRQQLPSGTKGVSVLAKQRL